MLSLGFLNVCPIQSQASLGDCCLSLDRRYVFISRITVNYRSAEHVATGNVEVYVKSKLTVFSVHVGKQLAWRRRQNRVL